MKTIYNTYVEMESQEQCDRMKQLCIDNGLRIWDDECAFTFDCNINCFEFVDLEFYISSCNIIPETMLGKQKITEQEFIKLLKNEKENK